MLNRWQKTVVDQRGNIAPWTTLIIRREADQMPATVYRDRDGTDPYPAGQVVTDINGFVFFYAAPDRYRITSQVPAVDWRDVGIGAPFDPAALEGFGTAAAADLIETRYDATPGRVATTGGFGLGVPGDGALEALVGDLDTALVSGDYYCAATCGNLPGDQPGFLSVRAASDPIRKLQRFVEDAVDGKEWRRIIDGTPDVVWKEQVRDPVWANIPVGLPVPIVNGAPIPPTDRSEFRYVLLTAGQTGPGGYNEGILTSETVTGSAPLVNATAAVSLAGSLLDGFTIHLINTEGRFIGAGEVEAVEDDSIQGHGHYGMNIANAGGGSSELISRLTVGSGIRQAETAGTFAKTGYGTPRISDHTQPRALRLPHYMRIL